MNDAIKEEAATFLLEDQNQPIPPDNVIAYNELRSCADLFRMHASGKLEIQPDFQRDVVWKPDEQARFIDSLVKQLPIPSMCFSLDHGTQKWKVIDGLQRMFTITSFLGTAEWRLGEVPDIHPLLRGKRNVQLRTGTDNEKRLYSSVEDISIPITVIRCSYDNASHMRYLFTIFNRLNSGGVRLNNQEIRNCIYSGPFNDLLKDFDRTDKSWSRVRRRIWGSTDRFRSVEILLRALAFSENLDGYDGNLAAFLNDYMCKYQKGPDARHLEMRADLGNMSLATIKVLDALGSGKRSLTFVEGLLVGILSNVKNVADKVTEGWAKQKAEVFVALPAFEQGARYGLANPQKVKERLTQSIGAFAQ